MRVIHFGIVVALLILQLAVASPPASAASCQFVLGFKSLHDLIPTTVGNCAVDEHHNPGNGDGLQETTGVSGAGGLLVWRKADNWTAFTDGNRTWINGPFDLESRFNVQRFLWEAEYAPDNEVPESELERKVCDTQARSTAEPLASACANIGAHLTPQSPFHPPQPVPTQPTSMLPATPQLPVVKPPPVPLTVASVDGEAIIVGADGQYLGVVSSNQFAADSICNAFGQYGSRFSGTSIRDNFGTYGSEFSSLSAYDSFTSTPPAIVYHDRVVGYLTKNTFKFGAVDPDVLIAALGCTKD